MRIGVDALSVVPGETGGGETYLCELLAALAVLPEAQEHDVVVYASENSTDLFPEQGCVRRVTVPLDNRNRVQRLLFEHLRLGSMLTRDAVDVLFAPGNALPLRVGCPTVLGVQSLHSFLVPQEMSKFRVHYFRSMVPRSARRATRVLCVSEDIRNLLHQVVPGLDAGKVRVVYEGAPEDLVRIHDAGKVAEVAARHGVEPGKFVLFISSLNPFKRPERAIQAVARVRARRGDPWPLLLAGRASEVHTERVMEAVRACGAEEHVKILGTVGREDLSALLSGARAMLYPSVVETFGLPPLEAMGCGCPVVASNKTSVPEITGDAALLVDPDDVESFAAAVEQALYDEDVRAGLIARGHVRAAHFKWEDAARGTLALLEEAARA